MSWKPVRRAALGLLFAILLGIAAPVPASAWDGESTAGFFASVWEWVVESLWPGEPPPVQPACTEDCGDAGYGADPNG